MLLTMIEPGADPFLRAPYLAPTHWPMFWKLNSFLVERAAPDSDMHRVGVLFRGAVRP
jgi:hypothetical protein